MLVRKPTTLVKHVRAIIHLSGFHSATSTDCQVAYLNSHINSFLTQQTPDHQTILSSHALIISSGNGSNRFISAKLISCYASIRNLAYSTKVFESIIDKDPFLWNSIIKSHFSDGGYEEAFELYMRMRLGDTLPNQFTVPLVVTACAELLLLDYGRIVHGLVSKIGAFGGNSAVGSSFIYLYAKCGLIKDAGDVFDEMNVRDVVAWTALLIGFVQNGESEAGLECFREMLRIGGDEERPNSRTMDGVIQACANLGAILEGRCIHGLALKNGVGVSQVVKCSLLSMYSKCGDSEESLCAFSELGEKDLIAWTSIISVYAKLGDIYKGLSLFLEMQGAGLCPDGVVISCMISAFPSKVVEGMAFHGYLLRRSYTKDYMVQDALLSMYSKSGRVTCALNLFNTENVPRKESWNSLVVAYGKAGIKLKCIDLFRKMQLLEIEPDAHCLISAVASCSQLGATLMGRSLHSYAVKRLMDVDISTVNSFIDMYGKLGDIATASKLFNLTTKNTVTWNTLISSHVHINQFAEALAVFNRMISEGAKPNSATMVTVLSACSQLAMLETGQQVHNYIKSNLDECNISVNTALIDMYSKCGKLDISREIFDTMNERDAISWNVMISSYGLHGDAKSAIDLFQQMEKSGATPNDVTFLAILSACSHAGLVSKGKLIFNKMEDYSVTPNLKHYACMVDLLGKSGHLSEAESFVLSMPIAPDKGIWGALLSACNIHHEVEMGLRIGKLALESIPGDEGFHVMVSNLNSLVGIWDEAEKSRILMSKLGVKKGVAWSLV
ncbi:unnamed protein product [Rhodiola kirilowii]